ncbi:MAG: hypothetical protein LBG94_03905 [Treponema sp.]|jgi:phosphoketolase|nr:hypothetical protein [Treponema sp.]
MNELTDIEKSELAQFFKRLGFNSVYVYADSDTPENMKAQTYRILTAIGKLQNDLAAQGYDPR